VKTNTIKLHADGKITCSTQRRSNFGLAVHGQGINIKFHEITEKNAFGKCTHNGNTFSTLFLKYRALTDFLGVFQG
jgi:hypothetical protein